MKRSIVLLGLMMLALGALFFTARAADEIERADPALDAVLPQEAQLEVVAAGFEWSEGPLWVPGLGSLLFSDIPKNTIYKWNEAEGIRVYLRPSGFTGPEPQGDELGTNGLLLDPKGRLTVCDHGNRCISRLNEQNFTKTVLADRYDGKRLNSPNDAVFHADGSLYFTDPPYGLRGLKSSPDKELEFSGVYRLSPGGELKLLTRELDFPNGIAFSPDYGTLYVANSDPKRPIWMAYPVESGGGIGPGRIFYDASGWAANGLRGAPDGMTVDRDGRIFATGPGGVNIFSADGLFLGRIRTGRATSNCTFGGETGSDLYITADMNLCRIKTLTAGIGF